MLRRPGGRHGRLVALDRRWTRVRRVPRLVARPRAGRGVSLGDVHGIRRAAVTVFPERPEPGSPPRSRRKAVAVSSPACCWRTMPARGRTRRPATGASAASGTSGSGRCEGTSEASGPPVGHGHDRARPPRAEAGALSRPRAAAGRPGPARPRDRRLRRRARPVLPRALRAARTSTRARSALPTTSRGCPSCRETRFEPTPSGSAPRSLGVQHGLMLQSSGTTGRPLDLFHDRRTVLLNVAYGERERAIETAFVGKRARYTRLQLGSDLPENVDRVRGFMAETSFRPLPAALRAGLPDPGACPRGRADRHRAPRHHPRRRLPPRSVLPCRRRPRRAEAPGQGAPLHLGSHVRRADGSSSRTRSASR